MTLVSLLALCGALWLLALWLGRKPAAIETYSERGPTRPTGPTGPTPPWATSPADLQARQTNSCDILMTLTDSGPGALSGTTIEIVAPSCESGLPHTTDAHTIRMTESVWNSPRREEILTHERVHLEQRRAPEVWRDFYALSWGYRIVAEAPPALVADTAATLRGNPDIYPERWAVWRDRYWFATTYTNPKNPHIAQAKTRVWDANKGAWLPEPPEPWRAYFCTPAGECPQQWEHPHEIAAVMWSDITRWTTPAAVALRNFMSREN